MDTPWVYSILSIGGHLSKVNGKVDGEHLSKVNIESVKRKEKCFFKII